MKERPKIKITRKTSKTVIPSPPPADTGEINPLIAKGRSLLLLIKEHALLSTGIFLLLTCSSIIVLHLATSSDAFSKESAETASATPLTEKKENFDLPDDVDLAAFTEPLKKMGDYKQSMQIAERKLSFYTQLDHERLPSDIVDELLSLGRNHKILYLLPGTSWYSFSAKSENDVVYRRFIYELSPTQSYLIQALPTPDIKALTKQDEVRTKAIAGIIKTDLWDAILERDGNYKIIEKMEDALKYVVDLYHIKSNDKFKILYEEIWVDEKVVDVGKLLAVSFETNNKTYFAIDYTTEGEQSNYVDLYGRTLKRKFLKSPVKYNRITSAYNPERIHPVLGDKRPHLGTDYYAKLGDPIFAVADGTITIAEFKENNGNYIKIKHDRIYETQYLHIMNNGFAPDIKPGAFVKQGQVIGYAGQTGLATGPHVCFRFWKNGKQVDPMKEDVVYDTNPMSPIDEEAFEALRDSLFPVLDSLPYFEVGF